MTTPLPLLDVRNLRVQFDGFTAVDGVSLRVAPGELLGIVGESGSGKSVAMLAVLGLIGTPGAPGVVSADALQFNGQDLLALTPAQRRRIVGRDIAMVFQDAQGSLNPSHTVGNQVREVLRVHLGLRGAALQARVLQLFEQVEIPAARARLDNYPHQLSGGMNQRVMIAMAIACEPKLLIADEPTTALDVTIQAQVMDLLARLQRERGMGLVLITHDLAVVSQMARRVSVLYAGQVVESGPVDALFAAPRHPYTTALLAALPEHNRGARRLASLPGIVPGQHDRPAGCLLAPRCPRVQLQCIAERPALADGVRCFYPLAPAPAAGVAFDPATSANALTSLLPLRLAGEGWVRSGDCEPQAARPRSGSGLHAGTRTASEGASSPLLRDAARPHPNPVSQVGEVARQGQRSSVAGWQFGDGRGAPICPASDGPAPVLLATDLTRHYRVGGGLLRAAAVVRALNGVSFTLHAGRTLAIVGESGCGKSTLARQLTLAEPPTAGALCIDGIDAGTAARAGNAALRRLRQRVQMVFQNPYASLNPRKTVAAALAEPLAINTVLTRPERSERVLQALARVGLRPEHAGRYPHMFSGGQRQRIAIARAMVLGPAVVVADEPTAALDVSIQAQVLNLFMDLQDATGTAYVFISHNLAVVEHVAHDVLVMYFGSAVEHGPKAKVLSAPLHPYTRALLAAVPVLRTAGGGNGAAPPFTSSPATAPLVSEMPNPLAPPAGCSFHTRCPIAVPRCHAEVPLLRPVDGRLVACHRV